MDENQSQINPESANSGRDAILSETYPPAASGDTGKSKKRGRSGQGSSFFKKIIRYIFISMFVISVITNFYLVLLLSGGMTERTYRAGDETQRIALISLGGVIDMQSAEQLRLMLLRAEEDETIKGVVLVINSPGGMVAPSNMMLHYIQEFKENTGLKVYASIQQLGASGAYWAAMAVDKIYGQTNARIGSIGVIYMNMVVEKALKEKLGINPVIVKSTRSPYKDHNSPFRQPTDEEILDIRKELDTIHARFVEVVRKGRNLDEDAAWALADGGVHDGPASLEKNLIDEIGFLDDVIDDLADSLGIKEPHVVRFVQPPTLREMLMARYPTPLAEEACTMTRPALPSRIAYSFKTPRWTTVAGCSTSSVLRRSSTAHFAKTSQAATVAECTTTVAVRY